MRVIWQPSAVADRDAIIAYIEERNPLAAFELLDALVLAADRIGEFPHIGRQGAAKDTREFVAVSPYILIYEVLGAEIRILAYGTAREIGSDYSR